MKRVNGLLLRTLQKVNETKLPGWDLEREKLTIQSNANVYCHFTWSVARRYDTSIEQSLINQGLQTNEWGVRSGRLWKARAIKVCEHSPVWVGKIKWLNHRSHFIEMDGLQTTFKPCCEEACERLQAAQWWQQQWTGSSHALNQGEELHAVRWVSDWQFMTIPSATGPSRGLLSRFIVTAHWAGNPQAKQQPHAKRSQEKWPVWPLAVPPRQNINRIPHTTSQTHNEPDTQQARHTTSQTRSGDRWKHADFLHIGKGERVQPVAQARALTFWWHPVFVRTAGQAPVVGVQARHVTRAVAARCRTAALLLVRAGGVCGQRVTWRGHMMQQSFKRQSQAEWRPSRNATTIYDTIIYIRV